MAFLNASEQKKAIDLAESERRQHEEVERAKRELEQAQVWLKNKKDVLKRSRRKPRSKPRRPPGCDACWEYWGAWLFPACGGFDRFCFFCLSDGRCSN